MEKTMQLLKIKYLLILGGLFYFVNSTAMTVGGKRKHESAVQDESSKELSTGCICRFKEGNREWQFETLYSNDQTNDQTDEFNSLQQVKKAFLFDQNGNKKLGLAPGTFVYVKTQNEKYAPAMITAIFYSPDEEGTYDQILVDIKWIYHRDSQPRDISFVNGLKNNQYVISNYSQLISANSIQGLALLKKIDANICQDKK